MNKSRLYLLAHPDDELMALPLLGESGFFNRVVFLTSGCPANASDTIVERRLQEVDNWKQVLTQLGIEVTFEFLTTFGGIPDAQLSTFFSKEHFLKLCNIVESVESPFELVTTSFEGAHQDHDAAAIVAGLIAKRYRLNILYFSTYRSIGKSKIFFHFMNPDRLGERKRFSRLVIVRMALKGIFLYRSQFKTWVGLGPMLVLKYLRGLWHIDASLAPYPLKSAFYENRMRSSFAFESINLARITLVCNELRNDSI